MVWGVLMVGYTPQTVLLLTCSQKVSSNRHCRQQMSGKRKGAI